MFILIRILFGNIQNCLKLSNNHEEHVVAMHIIWSKGDDTEKKIFAMFLFCFYLLSIEL